MIAESSARDIIAKSNGEALIGMIAEDLAGFLLAADFGGSLDLSPLFCQEMPDCEKGATDAQCLECVRTWLRRPYIGEFDICEGRIVRQE